jgi:serine protease SohB
VASLREEISAVLQVAGGGDEGVLRLESEGGLVHGYGLAASQLRRLRDRGVRLTVAVDKVAASGGYLMACVGDRILAAPFAVVGSIGVVGQLPNFNRLLKKHEIDWELHTAGEHKRTLTVFGENTEAGRAKFRETLEDAHALFKSFITDHRPQVAIEEVATGDHWFGARAVALKLVDELKTSDDYLLERSKDHELYEVRYKRHRGMVERLTGSLTRRGATVSPWDASTL